MFSFRDKFNHSSSANPENTLKDDTNLSPTLVTEQLVSLNQSINETTLFLTRQEKLSRFAHAMAAEIGMAHPELQTFGFSESKEPKLMTLFLHEMQPGTLVRYIYIAETPTADEFSIKIRRQEGENATLSDEIYTTSQLEEMTLRHIEQAGNLQERLNSYSAKLSRLPHSDIAKKFSELDSKLENAPEFKLAERLSHGSESDRMRNWVLEYGKFEITTSELIKRTSQIIDHCLYIEPAAVTVAAKEIIALAANNSSALNISRRFELIQLQRNFAYLVKEQKISKLTDLLKKLPLQEQAMRLAKMLQSLPEPVSSVEFSV